MTPNRPYLLRALSEWILDNDCTPYIIVSAERKDVLVPERFVEDGRIVLNISPSAVRNLLIENDRVEFDCRFSGEPFHVHVVMDAILAIYAKETGQGMAFESSAASDGEEPPPDGSRPGEGGAARLRLVK